MIPNKKPKPLFNIWLWLGILIAIQSVLAAWQLFVLPASATGFLFGLSAARLVVLSLIILVGILGIILAYLSLRSVSQTSQWLTPQDHPRIWDMALLCAFVTAWISYAVLTILEKLSQQGTIYRYVTISQRMSPLLVLLIVVSVEFSLCVLWLRRRDLAGLGAGNILRKNWWIGSLLIGVLVLIGLTGIGLHTVDNGYWGFPAVPLLEWQLLLAILLAIGVGLVELGSKKFKKSLPVDWIIAGVIWVTAAGLWISTPINYSSYATAPRAPNFEVYPFNDGLNYDRVAQSILTGNGLMNGDIPPRPLYSIFLTILHILVGQDYLAVINAQTIVLALFPAVMYLIGVKTGGRPLGAALALLVTLRDITTNTVAPFTIDVTYSKYYFSELPTALLLSLAALAVLYLVKNPRRLGLAVLTGGVIGAATLIRTQSVIVLPVFILAGWLQIKAYRRAWVKASFLIILGIFLAVSPWLIRNYFTTGGLVMDHPATQTYVLAQRYAGYDAVAGLQQEAEETTSQYSSRLLKRSLQAFLERPAELSYAILSNFAHNEIQNLQLLPLRNEIKTLGEFIRPTWAFWEGAFERQPAPLVSLAGMMAILGLGISAAWQKLRWMGLLPLGINLAYNLWSSLFLSSGERFLIPVDWAMLLYLVWGILCLVSLFLYCFTITRTPIANWSAVHNLPYSEPVELPAQPRKTIRSVLSVGVVVLAVGLSIPLSEKIFPQLYPSIDSAILLEEVSSWDETLDKGLELADLEELADQTGMQVYYGRAVFPRYYTAGDGEPNNAKLGFQLSAEPRLLFYLVGKTNLLVQLNLNETPDFIPNVSDVIVIAQQKEHVLYASLVAVEKDGVCDVLQSDGPFPAP